VYTVNDFPSAASASAYAVWPAHPETAKRNGKEMETDVGLHGDGFGSCESSQVSPPAAGMQFLLVEHGFYLSKLLYIYLYLLSSLYKHSTPLLRLVSLAIFFKHN